MATRVATLLIDDLDGSPASETVRFGIDNYLYEIDLSENNAHRLRENLSRFVDVATPMTPERPRTVTRTVVTTPSTTEQVRAIRDWAKKNGFTVSDRGRIPRDVLDAFNQAH
jgi:hypothetical protein